MEINEYGLVLAGGGAKGSYELGVWKALRELDINIVAVAGTSIGALNGALIVQNDYDLAMDLWCNTTLDGIISIGKEYLDVDDKKRSKKDWIDTIKLTIANGMLDASPMKKKIYEIIDEEKLRTSPIDFGIVTMSLSDRKPIEIYKADIPANQLADYLIASASFPAFGAHVIGDKKFIDGGVYNNIPVNLLLNKGIKNIIVVDIAGIGLNRKFDCGDTHIINIRSSEELGYVLDVNIERAKKNIEVGYYDTMKAFKKNVGKHYYISHIQLHNKSRFLSLANNFLGYTSQEKMTNKSYAIIISGIRKILEDYTDNHLTTESIFIALVEITAAEFGINRVQLYTTDELISLITAQYHQLIAQSEFETFSKVLQSNIGNFNKKKITAKRKELLIYTKFFACFDANFLNTNAKNYKLRRLMAATVPKIFLANFFLAFTLIKNKQFTSLTFIDNFTEEYYTD